MQVSSPIVREFFHYTSRSMFGMLGIALYILADTYFIAHVLGPQALAALNLVLPFLAFLNGSGLMLGIGGAALFALAKNRGQQHRANYYFSQSFLVAIVLILIIVIGGLSCLDSLTYFLGANADTFDYTRIYLQVMIFAAPAYILNHFFACFVRNDGAPTYAMLGLLTNSFANTFFDWLFMYPMGLGMFGAALASALAPALSLLVVAVFIFQKKNSFKFVALPPTVTALRRIIVTGMPSLVSELSAGVVIMTYNLLLLKLAGTLGVAAYGIVANLLIVLICILAGLAQGCQPLFSKYYGLNKRRHLLKIRSLALQTVLVIFTVALVASWLYEQELIGFFNKNNDPALQELAISGFMLYFVGSLFAGINLVMAMFYVGTNQPLHAHIITYLRGFALIIPVAYLMAKLFNVAGVWFSFTLSEFLVSCYALFPLLVVLLRRVTGKGRAVELASMRPTYNFERTNLNNLVTSQDVASQDVASVATPQVTTNKNNLVTSKAEFSTVSHAIEAEQALQAEQGNNATVTSDAELEVIATAPKPAFVVIDNVVHHHIADKDEGIHHLTSNPYTNLSPVLIDDVIDAEFTAEIDEPAVGKDVEQSDKLMDSAQADKLGDVARADKLRDATQTSKVAGKNQKL